MTIKSFIEGVGRRAIEALRWDENNPPVSGVHPPIPIPTLWLDKNHQVTDPPSFPDHPRVKGNPCVDIKGRGLSPLRGITTDELLERVELPWISINEDRRIIDSSDPKLIDARVTRFYMSRPDKIKVTLAYPNELQEGPKEVWVKREITTPLPLPIHTSFEMFGIPPVELHASDLRINYQPISDFASITRPDGREPEEITLELHHMDGSVTFVQAFEQQYDLPFDFNPTYPEGEPDIHFRVDPPKGKIKMNHDVYEHTSTTFLQRRSIDWLKEAWPEHPIRVETRATRFLEEAIELAQTQKISRAAMHELVDFVMDKDVGDVHKELGDANFCLLSLAEALGFDLGVVTNEVINDAYDRIPQIREKSKLKPKVDHDTGA